MRTQPGFLPFLLACGVLLALGACGGGGGVPQSQLAAEKARADAAADELGALRSSLENARAALKAVGSGANARANAIEALTGVEADLEGVQSGLMAQPASPARTAVGDALTAVGDAVAAVKAALAPISSSGGTLSFASMHTTLDRAQAALDSAQTRITAALAADGLTEALRTALSKAQAMLSTAQVALVPVLRDELAQAERNAAAQRGETTLGAPIAPERFARNIAPVFSTGGTANVTWTARTDAAGAPNPNGLEIKDEAVPYATGKKLFSAGGNGDDEFQLRGLTVHPYLNNGPDETGDLEFHGGIEGGSTGGVDNPDLGVSTGTGIMPNTPSTHADRARWQRTDARMLSSIRLRRDGSGFTMKMGGPGNIFGDMTRLTSIAPGAYSNLVGNGACDDVDAATCNDPAMMDVTAAFDNPAQDPDGDASWHFRMIVPANPATPITETRGVNTDGIPLPDTSIFTNDLGKRAYRVNPSYAGVVDLGADGALGGAGDNADTIGYANLAGEEYTDPADGAKYKVAWLPEAFPAPTGAMLLEQHRARRIDSGRPADQQGVYTVKLSNYAGVNDDDEHRYLQYAAYGLFNFQDYSNRWPRFLRIQAFHFGYDAFSDTRGARPMDFSTNVTTAKFNGKTTGWILRNPEGVYTSQLVRLRGDVTLSATLGGGSSNGSIEGSMQNFEYLRNGVWTRFAHHVFGHYNPATTDGVTLMPADIGADGSYAGVAKTAEDANRRFGEGRYGGAFYGPRTLGELETAGYWMLPRHIGDDLSSGSCHTMRPGVSCITFGNIVGSFGAVSEPPATE